MERILPTSLPSSPNTSPKQPRNRTEKMTDKLARTNLKTDQCVKVNWNEARLFTPGGLFAYKKEGTTTTLGSFDSPNESEVILFKDGNDSQGLVTLDDRVVGASVTTLIKSKTPRKKEKKSTTVQYDKSQVIQDSKDFTVNALNSRNRANYEGGHLIDHKFSAEGSHDERQNYIPEICTYNAPLKEYLVQRCDEYVEIPIYTENPPEIAFLDQKSETQAIPVGVVLILIKQAKIDDIYYFPQNKFSYEDLKTCLKLKSHIAENIVPYFKLEPAFHQLLLPAIIYGLRSQKRMQQSYEKKFAQLMQELTTGMSLASCEKDESRITKLCFGILTLQEDEEINPHFLLSCSEDMYQEIKCSELECPFTALGQFLVQYGLKNALKSEVYSNKSRLLFLKVICRFIGSNQVTGKHALDYVSKLRPEFDQTLTDLKKAALSLDNDEFLYLIHIFKKLSDPSIYDLACKGYLIYNADDILIYFRKVIELLNIFTEKRVDFNSEISQNLAGNLMGLYLSAQATFDYHIQMGISIKDYKEENSLLKEMCPKIQFLFDRFQSKNEDVDYSLKTNYGEVTHSRFNGAYYKRSLEKLGHLNSNSEEDSNNSSPLPRIVAFTMESFTDSNVKEDSNDSSTEPLSELDSSFEEDSE